MQFDKNPTEIGAVTVDDIIQSHEIQFNNNQTKCNIKPENVNIDKF